MFFIFVMLFKQVCLVTPLNPINRDRKMTYTDIISWRTC